MDGPKLRLTGGPLDHRQMDSPKLRLLGGPLDHRPFGRLIFVNLDGPNYAIWTKEPSFSTLLQQVTNPSPVLNCTASELPDVTTVRTDVEKVGWDDNVHYGTTVK